MFLNKDDAQVQTTTGNRTFSDKIENAWQQCKGNREGFRKYLQGDALSLRNLDWLFRHEMARQYLENALDGIDQDKNVVAFGCVSKMKEFFDLDINLNDGGDPDVLSDFTQACRSLIAEARADLYKNGSAHDISFSPMETYLADLETGTFGFYPVEYGGMSDDGIASWQR